MEKFILVFASINSEYELWQDIIGVYDSLEEAQEAMREDINYYLDEGGETRDEWTIKGYSATYQKPFCSVQKQYKIVKQNIEE